MSSMDGFVRLENGQRLYYQSIGDGLRTVIIPAGLLLAADFEYLRNENRRLLFYDQRGRGRSDPIKEESQVWVDYEINDVESIRDYFGITTMSLVGWSYLGGVVALYAYDYPHFIDRLVLMWPISIRSEVEYLDEEVEQKKRHHELIKCPW